MISHLSNKGEAEALIRGARYLVLHFYAEWVDQCQYMNGIIDEIVSSVEFPDVKFAKIPAEDVPDISLNYNVIAVPTFVLFKAGVVFDRVEGANPGDLRAKIEALIASDAVTPKSLKEQLEELINQSPVMIFMKGNPDVPRCGFSRQLIEILNKMNVKYDSFDILSDNTVREGLKEHSKWPTYPQLYVSGQLVGGLDIVKELAATGELKSMIPKSEISTNYEGNLSQRLEQLINSSKVMLFMKGDEVTPKCGFSKQIVQILKESNVQFKTFDILQDDTVRQGLKEYSKWPTYPQLYIKGQLIGGLDICKEMKETGDLEKLLS